MKVKVVSPLWDNSGKPTAQIISELEQPGNLESWLWCKIWGWVFYKMWYVWIRLWWKIRWWVSYKMWYNKERNELKTAMAIMIMAMMTKMMMMAMMKLIMTMMMMTMTRLREMKSPPPEGFPPLYKRSPSRARVRNHTWLWSWWSWWWSNKYETIMMVMGMTVMVMMVEVKAMWWHFCQTSMSAYFATLVKLGSSRKECLESGKIFETIVMILMIVTIATMILILWHIMCWKKNENLEKSGTWQSPCGQSGT